MSILAIDTASTVCATALMTGSGKIISKSKNIGRGHAEYLIGQISSVAANKDLANIECICVNIGPGSFTGIRVGVASARGFALALNKPVFGITAFEALAFEAILSCKNCSVTVVLKMSEKIFYMQEYNQYGQALDIPQTIALKRITKKISEKTVLVGSGSIQVSQLMPSSYQVRVLGQEATATIETYVHLGLLKYRKQGFSKIPVSPFYMCPPNAKPQI